MKAKWNKRLSSMIVCMVLAAAMAFQLTGCKGTGKDESTVADASGGEQNVWEDGSVLGEGSKQFDLTVADKEGAEVKFEIHTDQETVGDALTEIGLISGDESEYGLYVKTVNGITADYDADGVYWAFYVNGEYATSGVDVTQITEGDSYALKVE